MKKILLLIPVVFLCWTVCGKAQSPYFQRIYTTNIPSDLFFSDIAVSGSSEYILAGYGIVEVPYMDAIYLLKVNNFGIPIWHKTIRDSTRPSRIHCMVKKKNKYIVTGYSDSVYTLCVDDNGNTVWHKKYFQASHRLINIITTSDNGFIACGWINNKGLIIKTDSVGNLVWNKNFDAGYLRQFNKIIQHNNYFYLIGVRDDDINDIGKPVISRINLNGDSLVEKKFSFPDIRFSFENIIQRNNVFYIFGSKVQGSSRVRNFLLKCDLDFNLKDTITISSPVLSSSDDSFNHVSSYKDKFIMQSNVYPAFISDTIYNQFKLLDSNFNLIR
jgi:hypothetical protein